MRQLTIIIKCLDSQVDYLKTKLIEGLGLDYEILGIEVHEIEEK